MNLYCSDQVDPFNRQSLTLDMVIPNTELKAKILEWLDEQVKEPLTEDRTEMSTETHKEMTAGFKTDMAKDNGAEIITANTSDMSFENYTGSSKEE